MKDVPALLNHCFGPKSVSGEFHIVGVVQLPTNVPLRCVVPLFYPRVSCGAAAFRAYLTAVMSLQHSEQPDYSALKAGLSAALEQLKATPQQPLTF